MKAYPLVQITKLRHFAFDLKYLNGKLHCEEMNQTLFYSLYGT